MQSNPKPPSRLASLLSIEDLTRAPGHAIEQMSTRITAHGEWLQSLEIIGRWQHADIHPAARERLGIIEGQENLLLRLTWQSESQSLDRGVINKIGLSLGRACIRIHPEGTLWRLTARCGQREKSFAIHRRPAS